MKTTHVLAVLAGAGLVMWARGRWLAWNGTAMRFEWIGPPGLAWLAPEAR